MTLMRDLIRIPTSVSEGDFVVRASEGADLANYVVTDDLRGNFTEALQTIGHAVTTSRSQAKFLHGSFGAGKSHFMSVLREILKHNPQARAIRGLAEPVASADAWLPGKKLLCLTFHMLDARSVEQAVLEGYLRQITALHPDAPAPAVHRSDALLRDAAGVREMDEEAFFRKLGGDGGPAATGQGLASMMARAQGWTPQTYDAAAAAAPGTAERDSLVSALTRTFFSGAVQSGEYLDLDTGLQVITRHAKSLGYDAAVLFLDELILWLSTKIADHTFVNTEGAKLNKLVESSDAARPLPLVSFVARQRNLEEFLGPQVGGTEREALAHVMRSVQGRLGEIVLADTNLPEITEKRLLRPVSDQARQTIDDAFTAVRNRREVWDTLLLGAQYGDAGIGSDAAAFRRLYPFSPALVATLVALSQALQRERTALRVMTELLVARRDTLAVNDLIGVSALFDPLVLHGELPDRPKLRQQFRAARDTYTQKLRPLLLAKNGITEEQATGNEQFQLDDKLIKTLLLGALVPDVPALHNLNAARLHALNFGSIVAGVAGYENQIVIDRLTRLAADAGEIHKTDGPDPVFSLKLSSVDYDKLLELVGNEETTAGVLQGLIRDLTTSALGLRDSEEVLGEYVHQREWRGRKHRIGVKFGNIRNRETMPDSALYAEGDTWRIVVDYPFDAPGHSRLDDLARIEGLDHGSRTVFWLPLFLTDELMGRVGQLAKINYLLGGTGTGEKLNSLAADWSQADRQQGRIYLQQRQQQLRSSLADSLKQAYGVVKAQATDVELDQIPVLHTLADGLPLGDPRGGTMDAAFEHLTAELLRWSYPGTPSLPEDEKTVTKAELAKVWHYAKLAAASPDRGTVVDQADRRILQRVCNHLRLGELAENRYVLANSTCWWSQHLLQEAAKQDYRDHFPVHVLRSLLDQPAPRGFDRDLQNLVIAVFALEQQLAWYRHGGKLDLTSLNEISDQLELRHPPMPEPDVWDTAVRRARPLFGKPVPEWRSPAALAEFAALVRGVAKAHTAGAHLLLNSLTEHGAVLGLDTDAKSGRLATARRVAKLLNQIAMETDDVVLVSYVAEAEVGDIEDKAAAIAYEQAVAVANALAQTNWPLLGAVIGHVTTDERARVIIDKLRISAANDQNADNLVAALEQASTAATQFLADIKPVIVPPVIVDPDPGPDKDDPKPPQQRIRQVGDQDGLRELLNALNSDLTGGRTIRVTWEIV